MGEKYRKYSVLAVVLFTYGCLGEKVFNIKDNQIDTIQFTNLPLEIKSYLDENIDTITKSDIDFYFSTDKSVDFTYGRSGASNNWLNEIHSNYHHFFINGLHYKIRGNKGAPFIFHNGYIYFCDLIFYKDDYKDRKYYRVKISLTN
jgi:hypothetical protein